MRWDDPGEAATALAGSREPYLLGVRHHSPSLAAAVPRLLARAEPEVVFVELPEEFADWLPHLADPAAVFPLALAGSGPGGLTFLPFADFSPELAAIRWAHAEGVPVVPFDLPLAARAPRGPAGPGAGAGPLTAALRGRAGGRAHDDLWDRLVEAAAPGGTPEALRRAALLVGWALRQDAAAGGHLDPYDLSREAHMRRRLAERPGVRAAAVVGAFHGPALLPGGRPESDGPEPDEWAPGADGRGREEIVTSLVPYTYPLLDERSGYPAGIRDPEWQHGVLEAAGDPAVLDALLSGTAVRLCAAVRAAGHPCGPADAREIVRFARDLATVRGLPAAGRVEFAEAVEATLAQGRLLGRGRVVAAAMERVLVGERHGRLAPGTPRSGLGPAVEKEVAALGLPGPHAPARREVRLDPSRSALDRRREVFLRRLSVCRIPYGQRAEVAGVGDGDAVTTRWTVEWTPSAAAMAEVAGVRGVTAGQAAGGTLRQRRATLRGQGGPTAAQVLEGLEEAAGCGLPELAAEYLAEAAVLLPEVGTLPELLAGVGLMERLRAGHVPGVEAGWRAAELGAAREVLTAAGVRALDGLAGSQDPADARAMVELAVLGAASGGGLRLADALARLDAGGTPMVKGAAGAARVLLGEPGSGGAGGFGERLAARAHGATTPALRADLTGFLRGALTAAGPLLEAGSALDPLVECVEEMADSAFVSRLPALRAGFDTLAPAARERLLSVVEDRTGVRTDALASSVGDPVAAARLAAADLAGRTALRARGLRPAAGPAGEPAPSAGSSGPVAASGERELPPADRWRLLLGRGREHGGRGGRLAAALDELYGSGRGEGSRSEGAAGGGGTEVRFPDVREWSRELAALFGPGVREEVLAAAADAGRLDAALEIDPAAARPSVDLLRTVLSYAGGLPEQQLARLRPLVARLVRELTEALAIRLRPALSGLASPRPTRRPGGPLDLAGTLRGNLATARRDPDSGRVTVLPERPVFRTRVRASADWRLVLVVDVSGSMEASVIWSALTAAVLAGVPTLSTHFVAFSTEVMDLTGQVDDPLGLLLEVRVGGGTSIARGLRHARELVTVPSRTLVVLVSDFEEGGPVGPMLAEVRALTDAGCHVLGCASLDDAGRPRYSAGVAGQLVAAGMPVAALSPLELAHWVRDQVGGTHR